MTEPTKPTTRTKQYRLDVLVGRAIGALTDVMAAKDEDAFYQLKDKLEEALGNWVDENLPLGEAEEATPAERSKSISNRTQEAWVKTVSDKSQIVPTACAECYVKVWSEIGLAEVML